MITNEIFQKMLLITILLIDDIISTEFFKNKHIANKKEHDLTNIKIEETISKLREGQRIVKMPQRDHITLFMGDIDSGKTTLVNFLRNDYFYTLEAVGEEMIDSEVNETQIFDAVNNQSVTDHITHTKSLFPTLLYDSILEVEYYVCPSFFQNTNLTLHIVSSFFINKILQHAKRAKFIFVANAQKLIDNQKLLVDFGKFFKNIEKYKNSFALILTNANKKSYSDAEMTLKLVKDDSISENMNTLINILLNKTENVDKIGLFHIPPKNGFLFEMESMNDDREKLLNLIDSIDYTKISRNDFDFQIEENPSKNPNYDINAILKETTQKLSSSALTIAEEIYEALQNKEKKINNLIEVKDYFVRSREAFKIVTNNSVESFKNTTKLIKSVKHLFKEISLTYSVDSVLNYRKYNNFFIILQMAIKPQLLDDFPIETELLQNTFKNISKFIDDSINIYSFFINLYFKLGDWRTQQDTSKYSVISLKRIIQALQKSQATSITGKSLEPFFKQLYKEELKNAVQIPHYQEIFSAEFNAIKLAYLFKILDATLKKKVQLKCIKNNRIIVRGDYIKLSDVIRKKVCPNVSLNQIKLIDIKALFVIFIDTNLTVYSNVFRGLRVIIVAPMWRIIRNRQIILAASELLNNNLEKAPNGTTYPLSKMLGQPNGSDGQNGLDGVPGKPGYPGGSFFGIGNIFINGRNLTIKSIGGNGSIGQEGGNGGAGEKANSNRGFGGNGGAGGNGGRGGLGGLAGNIQIFELGKNSEIIIDQINGTDGYNGAGGMGGKGGANGKTGQGSNGANGTDGGNIVNMEMPVFSYFKHSSNIVNNYKAFILDNLNDPVKKPFLLPTYKKLQHYKISNLYDTLSLVIELENLEQQYYKSYDKVDFFPLYNSLLERLHEYFVPPKKGEHNKIHKKAFIFIYSAIYSKICSIRNKNADSLIIDIYEYLAYVIGNIQRSEKTNNLLVQAEINQNQKERIDAKIVEGEIFLQKSVTPVIQTTYNDIEKSFRKFINNIIALEALTKSEKTKLNYYKTEAKKLLIVNMFFNCVQKAVGMVGMFAKIAKPLSGLLDALTSFAHSVSLTAIDSDFSVNNARLPDGVYNTLNELGVFATEMENEKQPVLEYVVDLAKAANTSECGNLQQRLVEIHKSDHMTTNHKFDKFKKLIDQCLNNQQNKSPTRSKRWIQKRQAETQTETKDNTTATNLTTTLTTAEAEATIEFNNTKKINNWLEHSKKVLSLADMSIDLYRSFKDDERQVDCIQSLIEEKQQRIKDLQEFKASVYYIILPLVKKIFSDINVALSQYKLYSNIALDLTHWQLKVELSRLKSNIHRFTKGFAAHEKFDLKFTELSEAFDIIIKIYGRIKDYNDNKKLADLLYEIESAQLKGINVKNPLLKAALPRLSALIKTNLISLNYNDAMNGLRQYIFPFAEYYLREFHFPKDIVINDTVNDFVYHTIEQIHTLRLSLIKSNAIIYTKHDEYLIKQQFNSDKKSLQPFYVWPNNLYYPIIQKLLNGEEVILYADITKGPMKNAIKFNRIELQFKSKIPDVQNTVNKLLENFEIRLRHLGQSVYRCDKNFFVMSNLQQYIRYSFAKDLNNEPIRRNNIYDKLKKDFILSPYAYWSIQIVAPSKQLYFELQNYAKDLDLELGGYGQYVSSSSSICKTNLEDYYVVEKNLKSDYTIKEEDES